MTAGVITTRCGSGVFDQQGVWPRPGQIAGPVAEVLGASARAFGAPPILVPVVGVGSSHGRSGSAINSTGTCRRGGPGKKTT